MPCNMLHIYNSTMNKQLILYYPLPFTHSTPTTLTFLKVTPGKFLFQGYDHLKSSLTGLEILFVKEILSHIHRKTINLTTALFV